MNLIKRLSCKTFVIPSPGAFDLIQTGCLTWGSASRYKNQIELVFSNSSSVTDLTKFCSPHVSAHYDDLVINTENSQL